MGLFKKKKKEELPLPPPPSKPVSEIPSDFEPIRPEMEPEPFPGPSALPPLPELPEGPPVMPEGPAPRPFEMPVLAPPVPGPMEEPPFREQFPVPAREEEVYEEIEQYKEPPVRRVPTKSFVAVEDYKRIMDESSLVRGKLMEAESLIKQLKEVKDHEERLFQRWRSHIEQIEKKLSHVDQVISKAQG